MNSNFLFLLSLLLLGGCKTLDRGISDPFTDPAAAEQQTQALARAKKRQEEREWLNDYCQKEPSDKLDVEAFDDVWLRIRAQLTIDTPENNRIKAQRDWYANHPSYMQRVSERASPYLFHIVERLEQTRLPLELALLPIVESAFDPFAYSHGRASGMWQFIPGTGKKFGLAQNWWYDGRRDVYWSTEAAIQYLTHLHQRFNGDWLHALAAYNSGEGNVSKAIAKNLKKAKPTDFWSLDLPQETRDYVPKLLALSDMLKKHDQNPQLWSKIDNLPVFDQVETKTQIDLTLIADLAELSMSDFYQLNPSYNQWATPPQGPHSILLPVEKIDTFKRNLKQIPENQRISFKKYTIKKGDSLLTIAKKFSTRVELLRETNEISGNSIIAGQSLLIPVASEARDKYSKSSQQRLLAAQNRPAQNKDQDGQKLTIEVESGDSMWDLSRKYRVDIRSLAKWNNMAPSDPIRVGQKLVVWQTAQADIKIAAATSPAHQTKKIHYRVRNGDSLAKIADKFKVSLASIKQWNQNSSKKKYLQPGESVMLYVDITKQF